ncbi:hypothetical protein SLA2020_443400 [Shorea laevis]
MGSLSLYSITTLFVILATIIPSLDAEDDAGFSECSRPFSCGIFKTFLFLSESTLDLSTVGMRVTNSNAMEMVRTLL